VRCSRHAFSRPQPPQLDKTDESHQRRRCRARLCQRLLRRQALQGICPSHTGIELSELLQHLHRSRLATRRHRIWTTLLETPTRQENRRNPGGGHRQYHFIARRNRDSGKSKDEAAQPFPQECPRRRIHRRLRPQARHRRILSGTSDQCNQQRVERREFVHRREPENALPDERRNNNYRNRAHRHRIIGRRLHPPDTTQHGSQALPHHLITPIAF
jgi:hypothetical protein